METADTYNYPNYSFAIEAAEMERWLAEGPHARELAPDFRLPDLDGIPAQLSQWRGKPVVLEFGSYTCPIFSDRVTDMERLAQEHPEAEFLVIAIREAHPGEITSQHTTLAQKRQAARCLAIEEGIRRRVLVDDLQGMVHRTYGGAWDPVYVIDPRGGVAFRRAWNDPGEVAQALEALPRGVDLPPGETTEMAMLPGRTPMGLRLLERGGRQALLDFYRTVPPPFKKRLEKSASAAVRAVIAEEARDKEG
jgi:peroxiredoxin